MENKLNIPLGGGNIRLYSKNGLLLSDAYTRVVIGDRGPYVEMLIENLNFQNIAIPDDQRWRIEDPKWNEKVYYVEYRSQCDSYVKIYWQMRRVNYADYRIGRFYISPSDLYLDQEGKEPVLEVLQDAKSS